MARMLMIDDEAIAKAKKILAHAELHPYRAGQPIPGDDPELVALFNTYRAVFSYTEHGGLRLRHLSVSIPADGLYPDPYAVFILADLFGFTGYDHEAPAKIPPDWSCKPDEREKCVVVIQPIGTTVPKEQRQ